MKTLLTVPIQASSTAIIDRQLRKSEKNVDAYELWIDHLPRKELTEKNLQVCMKRWKKMSKKKLVVVCKDSFEQGKFRETLEGKVELLLAAAEGGADYVDIGLHSGKKWIETIVRKKKQSKIILSHHDFKKTPSVATLRALAQKMVDLNADIIKISTLVHTLEDTQRLMDLALQLKGKKVKHIVIGMGEKGISTRILGQKLENELHFVSLDSTTAAGQLTLEQARAFQNVLH